jgi:hypothetical protein
MREIQFRGKATARYGEKAGEWVFGNLLILPVRVPNVISHCVGIQFYEGNELKSILVNNETVGQYTGLTLKKTKVYEGDIIKCDKEKFVVVWEECGFYIKKITAEYEDGLSPGSWRLWEILAYRSHKVIGNIHDNKELLEEGK